jgi:hypothetical protein
MPESFPGTPGNWFIEELCELRYRCGTPSYQQIIAITRRLDALYGQQYAELPVLSKTVLSNVLGGLRKGVPTWPWVAAYVLACQYHGNRKACLLLADPGPATLTAWHERLRQAAAGMRAAGPPPYETLPLATPRAGRPPEPAGESPVRMDLRPGDEQELLARLIRRYRAGGGPGPAGPAGGSAPGEGTYLAAPVGKSPRRTGGRSVPGPDLGQTRLPTADELLVRIQTGRRRSTPSYRLTSSGAASYGGDHLTEPPLDLAGSEREGLTRARYRDLLGRHGVDLLEAAEHGDADAAGRLGVLFVCALLPGEAQAWLSAAAQAGDTAARCLIHVEPPWRRTIAAEIAYDLALPEAGHSVADVGVDRGGNPATCAEVYYRAAADCGHLGAMYRLAVICRTRGTEDEAAYWFNQAADAGHPDAPRQFEEITAEMIREGFSVLHLRGPVPAYDTPAVLRPHRP